ncbi:MAG: TIGR00159 family protein [Candidatus Omnitrophota bacterium]|nr:MAG: TIGR00159 family protein [Candidatus Omnitrophota bacterium]
MDETIIAGLKIVFEIFIIWGLLYKFMLFIRGTRVVPLLRGVVVLIILFCATDIFNFEVVHWILTKLFTISVIGFLILFQPEIRRGLSKIGQNYLFDIFSPVIEEGVVSSVSQSIVTLAQKRIGALIAFERSVGLKTYVETGVRLEGVVTPELVNTIFAPLGPLHDGGVIVGSGRVVAAGCLFPLTQNDDLERSFGTRHRAALGLSEDTDAVVVVVSEETGKISIAQAGKLIRDFEGKDFRFVLKNILQQQEQKKKRVFYKWRQKK